ncbi:MAG: hypothetical protein ACOYOU_17180, partial [Kiritimatiellia bacterium]
EDVASFHVGKHETGHLLGYLYHDNFPLFVIGYPGEWSVPTQRDTLMMMTSTSDDLSPRDRDALTYFWRGMEAREKRTFFKKTGE